MFKQIKDLGTQKTTPDNTDLLPIQQADGVTRRISRENFLSGISGGSSADLSCLNTIIHRDANWNLATRINQYVPRETLMWTSFGIDGSGADSLIGTLKIGYLTLNNKLHISIGCGGGTNPNAKTLSFIRKIDNTNLLTLNAGQILGVDANF